MNGGHQIIIQIHFVLLFNVQFYLINQLHNIDFQLDLIDVNDNPPIFNQSIYQINIYENNTN